MNRPLVNYEKYAKMKGLKINKDMEQCIVMGLMENTAVHGFGYCPCMVQKNPDTICPCKPMKTEVHCHCGLYMKE